MGQAGSGATWLRLTLRGHGDKVRICARGGAFAVRICECA